MDKKYLQDLWNWSNGQDPTLQERYTFEDWTNKLQSEGQYRQKFYDWIGTVDPTHSERRPYQSWEGMVAGVAQPTSKKKEESASQQPQEVISSATREMGSQQPLVYFQDLVRRADAAISQGKQSEYKQLKSEIENLYKQSGDVLNTEETKAEIDKLNQRYSNIFKEQEPIRFLDPAVKEKVPFKETPKKQLDELAKKGATDVEYTPEERKVLMDIELNIKPNVDYDGIDTQVQEELSDYSRRQVRTKRGMISAPYVDNSAQESINMAIDELVDAGKELTDQSILERAAEIRTQQVKNAKEYNAIENYYEGASIVGKTEGQKEKQATLEAIKEKRKAHLVNFENKVNEIDDLALGLEEFNKISQKRALTQEEKIDYLDTFNKYTRLHRDLVKNYENIENDTRLVGDFESELDAFKRNHTYITSGGAKATAALARIGAGLSGFAGMTRAAVYDLMGDEDAFEKAEVFVEKGEDINAWADSLLDGVSKSQQLDDAETVGDYAEWAGGMIVENTPQILINVLTGGKAIPFLSASAAGEKYMELYGDEAYSKGQKYLASILVGGGTAVSELLELAAFKKLWPSKKVAKAAVSKVGRKEFERAMSKGVKKSVKDRFKQAGTALAGVNQEGFSEVVDQLSRNAVNKFVLDRDVSLADGLGDAYLSGAVVGAGLGAAPHIFSGVVRPFVNDPNGDIIKNINKIQKLKESLLDADEKLKPVLQDRINQLTKQNEDLVQKAVKGLDNLSPKEIKDGIRIYEDIVKARNEYQAVKNDESMSEDVKEATIDAIESRYNELVEKRTQLINKANAVQEQGAGKVPVQQDAAVSEEGKEIIVEDPNKGYQFEYESEDDIPSELSSLTPRSKQELEIGRGKNKQKKITLIFSGQQLIDAGLAKLSEEQATTEEELNFEEATEEDLASDEVADLKGDTVGDVVGVARDDNGKITAVQIEDNKTGEITVNKIDEQQTLAPEQGTRTPIERTKLRDNIKKAVAKIFPKTDSFSFKNGKEMAAYALEKYGATVGETEGARVFIKGDGSVEILVNEELSDDTSFGHEIWHAVLLKSFGDSQKKFKDFRRGINKTLRQNGFEDLADQLDDFAAQYGEDEVPSEEYLAQLGGILTSSNIDLTNLTPQQKSLLEQIKDLINSFAIELTGEPVFLEDATPADILNFMSTMSDMMARGEDISGFIKDGTKKQATKTRAQVVGAFSGQLEKMGISVGTTNEKTGKTKVTNFDIASALNEYYNKTYGKIAPNDFSEKAVNAVSEYATTEMLFALSEFGENSGKGWYTEDYSKALETLSSLDESIKKDPKIKEVATAIIAVASNSSDVYTNLTRLIYGLDGFKTNKSVPLDVGTGKGASAISAGIKRYNQLLEKFENDPSQVAKFMQQIDTIANLKKKLLSEFKLSSYAQALKENLATNPEWNESETLPMSVLIFGPKIGAFYSNLSGLDGTPTIDRWCIRTVYRYKGDMRAKVSSKEMNAFMSDNKIEGASESDAFALAEEHAKLFNAILTGRGEYKGLEKSKRNAMLKPYRKGSQIWSKAKGVVNDIAEGADDTVSNKSQYGKDFRSFTKEVFEKARDMVAEKAGVKLSVSDVQAILWIYEKNLFGHLGVKQREDSTYSSAANSLVSKVNSGALTIDALKSGDLKALSVPDIETEGPMGDKFGSDVKSFKEGIDSRQKRSQEGVEVKTRAQKSKKPSVKSRIMLGIKGKFSNEEKKNLVASIKAQIRATKDLLKSQKEVKAKIKAEIKELFAKGTITTRQMQAVLNRMSELNLMNEEAVAKFVDYMARVFKNAEYYERVSSINRKRRAARKGAETKAGIADGLLPLLQKVFSVDARVIPENVLDAYESLINQFSERAVVLTLGDIDALTKQAKEVLNSIETELERAEALAEIFDNYENKILDDEGKVQFAQTINDMVDNDSITAEDAEIMKKYKSTILGPKETDKRSEEEIEEERQEKIEQIKSFKEVFFSLPTLDERNVARKLFELIKTSAIEKLDLKDLNNLLKVIDNIENGFLPHYAQIINEKMEAINNGDNLANATEKANLLPIEKATAKIKSLLSRGGPNYKAIERNPLYFIDELFGNFEGTPIFKSIFEPVSKAFSRYKSEINTINDKMDAALKAISNSYGKNPNKVQKSKQKMMAYLLQKEFQANPNSKEVNSAKAFLDETIKYIEESEEQNNYSERDLENLKELRDTLFASEEVDLDAIFNTFNEAEKKAINVIDQINSELSPKVSFTSTIIRGRKVGAINQYVHHNTLVDKPTSDNVTDLNIADVFNRSWMPSTKAKNLEERTGKATPLVFDPFSSTQRGAKHLLMDYYLTEPIRTARRSLKHAGNQVKGRKKRVIKAIEKAMEQALSNTLTNTYHEGTWFDDAISYIEKTGYRNMLGSLRRAPWEFLSNILYVALYDPISFLKGIKDYGSVMMSEDGLDVMKNLRSQQIERLYPASQLSGRLIDSQVMSQASGIKPGKSLNAVNNAASIAYNYSLKQAKNLAETTSDYLVSAPDKMVMKPLWFGAFAREFKKQTGQDVDFSKLSKNNEVYMTKYKEALDLATSKADDSSMRVGASDNPFTGILKGSNIANQKPIMQILNKYNRFMTKFLTVEYSNARTGIYALVKGGKMSKRQGAAILGATMTRMIVYTFSMGQASDMFKTLLGFDDDEEDEDTLLQKVGQATGSALTGLLLGRNFGNLVKAPINIGVEEVNKEFLDFLREGEYDPYENSLQYTVIPKDERKKGQAMEYIKAFSGAFGPAITTSAKTIEIVARSPKRPDAVERRMKELKIRVPLEIIGNLGYVPLYKDIRKITLDYLYKDMKKAKSSQKRSPTGKPKPIVLGK